MSKIRRNKSIDIVLKVSERCNLACKYCYFFFNGDQTYNLHSPVIKPNVIDQLCEWIKNGIQDVEIDDINIGFHGGEPLMMKKNAFDQLCRKLRACETETTHIHFNMQTNATLIDEEWIDLFSEHGVGVGVSIDGPKAINDAARVDKKGRGSHDAVVAGLNKLKAAAAAGRIGFPGILTVIEPSHDPAIIYDHIVKELDCDSLNFLFPREGWDTEMEIEPQVWRNYVQRLVSHWSDPGTKRAHVRILSDALQGLISDNGARLQDENKAAIHNVLTISSDGDLGPDDNLKPLDPKFQHTGMTIFDTSFAEFLGSAMWQGLLEGNARVPDACQNCEWERVCGSGHLFNRYDKAAGFARESIFCAALDELHIRLTEYAVAHGISLGEISHRLAQPSTCHPAELLNVLPQSPEKLALLEA
jgi:uncharacterized protein